MSKLYTEEQVRNLTEAAFMAGQNHNPFIFQIELNKLTPIELPSDEEIEEQSWGYREVTKDMEIPPNEDWYNGAKWMIDKIKGGNDETH